MFSLRSSAFCDKTPARRSRFSNICATMPSRALSSSVQSSSAPRQRGSTKNVLVLFFDFPPARHRQLNGCHGGLKVQPEGLALLIGAICGYQDWRRAAASDHQYQVPKPGGLATPAGSPPGDSSPRQLPARHGGLTPSPSGATLPLCSELGGRAPTGPQWRGRGEIISRGHNGRSGWFWRFQLHPMRPGNNSRRWGVLGGLRARQKKLANRANGRKWKAAAP
jgi:hypothetical protein